MLSASPLRTTAASPLRGLRGSPAGVPTDKRLQQEPTMTLNATCRGIEVGRDGDGGGHIGTASTPPPGVAADFQQTIDRLRSDNAACQARLDVLVEANRQRKYVMPASDYKREGDHLSDMIRFGSSEWSNIESNEGLMKPLGMSRPLPENGCAASTQDLFFKLRTDLDNSQAHASSLDKAVGGLRRELHSVREQLLLQSSQTQRFVQDLRRDVDALRNGGSIVGHLSARSCGQSVRHGGLSPVVGRESASSPGIGDLQLQELRSELLDLRGALRTVDAECRRIAATSAAGPPSWPSDGRRRIATEDSILQPLQQELHGLRLDMQRLEQETAPLARSVGALWAEVENFRAGVPDPSQACTHAQLAASGTAPLSTITSVGIGVPQQRTLVSPRNAALGCSAGFHLLPPHLSSSGQMLLQDADPRIALLQGPHSLEHQALYFEKGCYSAPGTGRSNMAVAAMTAAEDEEACRKMVAMLPKQPVVEHSTLDSTMAREDLLRALQAVQEMQDHDMPLLRCGLLSSDSDSCRE